MNWKSSVRCVVVVVVVVFLFLNALALTTITIESCEEKFSKLFSFCCCCCCFWCWKLLFDFCWKLFLLLFDHIERLVCESVHAEFVFFFVLFCFFFIATNNTSTKSTNSKICCFFFVSFYFQVWTFIFKSNVYLCIISNRVFLLASF